MEEESYSETTCIQLKKSVRFEDWYQDGNTRLLFIHCLLTSDSHGRLTTTLPELARETSLSEHQVRTGIDKLMADKKLTQETTNKYRILAVLDYDSYTANTCHMADKWQTNDRQSQNNTDKSANSGEITEKESKREKNQKREVNKELLNNIYISNVLHINDIYITPLYPPLEGGQPPYPPQGGTNPAMPYRLADNGMFTSASGMDPCNDDRLDFSRMGGHTYGGMGIQDEAEHKKPTAKPKTQAESTREFLTKYLRKHEFSTELTDVVQDWIEYKIEKKSYYKERGMNSLLNTIAKNCHEYGEAAVINIINDSMSSNYLGIVWDRLKKRSKRLTQKVMSGEEWLHDRRSVSQNDAGN